MRYSRVLLVVPPEKAFYGALRPPLGLGYLAESLKEAGIEYRVLDMLLGYGLDDLKKLIHEFQPDLIGLTMYTINYKRGYEFIGRVKDAFSQIPVAVGGAHISTFKQKVMEECQSIDFGILLEGEETLVELCQGREFEQIKGLMYRRQGKLRYTVDRPFDHDLDRVPFPTFEKFEMDRYIREIPLLSSRGCPFGCIFCQVGQLSGRRFRARSPLSVLKEIDHWYARGYRQFNFMDDNFSFDPQRVHVICELLEKRGYKDIFIRCAGLRFDRVDRVLLERMKEVGFNSISFGVEAGNDKVLRALKKGERIETIKRGLKDACDLGYDVNLFFLVGSPQETWQDFMDSVELALSLPVFRVNFYNIIPYPHTEIYDWLKQSALFIRDPEEYLNRVTCDDDLPVFVTPEMPYEMRQKALRHARKVERKVLQKAIRSKLEKYRITGQLASAASYILSRNFAEKLVFQNVFVRKIAERLRYRAHISKESIKSA
jgi:radical SAM superfamily enzyme YgiQ (UPF0313 family)